MKSDEILLNYEVQDLEKKLKISTSVDFVRSNIVYETPEMEVEIPTKKKKVTITYAKRGNTADKSSLF